VEIGCCEVAERSSALPHIKTRALPDSAPILPKMGRSRPKLPECCRPLTCRRIPNLVWVGCVLPDLFRKDWVFGPKSHYNIVFQPTTNSVLSTFVTVKCERSGHCGVNSGLRINTFTHTVRFIQFLTVKCHFWLDLDAALIAQFLYYCQSVDYATLFAARWCISAAYAVMRCPSVCPSVMVSVMFVYSAENNKCIFNFFHRRYSHNILVFPYLTGV